MVSPITVFLGSVVLFTALSLLVHLEEKRGKRLLMGKVRGHVDAGLLFVYRQVREAWDHFVQFIVKLGWYYSIHSFLRTLMNLLVSVYDYLEYKFERNRARASVLHSKKRERDEQSQLSQVAEHKEQVALTAEEGERLRAEKLEERD
jgi:hypothetical protein